MYRDLSLSAQQIKKQGETVWLPSRPHIDFRTASMRSRRKGRRSYTEKEKDFRTRARQIRLTSIPTL